MHTIALRHLPALASAHLFGATMSGTAGAAVGAAGGITVLNALVLIIAFVTVVASAMRGLAALLSELLQVAAKVTSLLFTAVIVIAVAAVVLVIH